MIPIIIQIQEYLNGIFIIEGEGYVYQFCWVVDEFLWNVSMGWDVSLTNDNKPLDFGAKNSYFYFDVIVGQLEVKKNPTDIRNGLLTVSQFIGSKIDSTFYRPSRILNWILDLLTVKAYITSGV